MSERAHQTETGVPFVVMKIAQTLDGKIADARGRSRWITNERSREAVHRLRSMYDAVLVGAGTVNADDPLLTVRHVKGRNPLRVIVDGMLIGDPLSLPDVMAPHVVDFMVVLSALETGVQYGSIGHDGALLIFTKAGLKRRM